MKLALLEFLECPVCHRAYALRSTQEDEGEIMEGALLCACGAFPIVRGVPRILPGPRQEKNWETAVRFGEEWRQFDMLTDQYEAQFLSWIEPVKKEHFVEKVVLDVGCGKGRHVFQAKRFGARHIVGIDLSHAVDAAFKNVGRLEGVHIIQADIFHLPLKPVFDYVYSIGVLHHTPEPQHAFQKCVEKIKPNGTISAWVYGREGNGWIIYLLNPFRWLTSRLPLSVTKAIAFFLTCFLQAGLIVLYRPAEMRPRVHWLKRILPYSAYLCSISIFSFRENFSIVFDHLLPAIAHYIRRADFEQWFLAASLERPIISQRYGNSWRGFAKKI